MSSAKVDPMTGVRFREDQHYGTSPETAAKAQRVVLRQLESGRISKLDATIILASLGLIPDSVGFRAIDSVSGR